MNLKMQIFFNVDVKSGLWTYTRDVPKKKSLFLIFLYILTLLFSVRETGNIYFQNYFSKIKSIL
jgi:hypothetical protein